MQKQIKNIYNDACGVSQGQRKAYKPTNQTKTNQSKNQKGGVIATRPNEAKTTPAERLTNLRTDSRMRI